MKTLQETILELARSQSVVTAVLESVGPPRGGKWPAGNPTPEDIAGFRDSMVMTPPGGAEFGKTEVFYLGVCDRSPERAAQLVGSLSDELERRSNEIRDARAQSMVDELSQGLNQAEAHLKMQIDKLADFETRMGLQLGDLRGLESPLGGSSNTSQNLLAIQAELRANTSQRRQNEKLLEVLATAASDPDQLVATPSTLLVSQPGLDRLKQGLVDAQLAKARLLGKFSAEHPTVVAAEQAEQQVRSQLHRELAIATRGVEIELDLSRQREEELRSQLTVGQHDLAQLASHRAEYSNLIAAVNNHTTLVENARRRLAEAEARQAGAKTSSLLARIDEVESPLRPLGPGRASIVLAGGIAGLVVGLGLIYWLHGPESSPEVAPALSTSSLTRGQSNQFAHATSETFARPTGTTPPIVTETWAGTTFDGQSVSAGP
jgi:succinoglycan biosynthesis transport protein ExoP